MSEPQLERSVLESKDREELFAIAEALGSHPTSRAKKSDLVTQILRTTGVEAPPEGGAEAEADKPRRTRARKAAEAQAAVSESEGGGSADQELAAGGAGAAAEAREDEDRGTAEPEGSGRSGDAGAGSSAAGDAGAAAAGRRRPTNGRAAPDESVLPAAANGAGLDPASAAGPAADRPASDRPSTESPPTDRPVARRPANGQAGSEGGSTPSGPPGPGQGSTQGPAQGADHQGQGQGQGADHRDSGGGGQNEPGNRRNRRRRGRDRERGERDLQSGGQASADPASTGEPSEVKGLLDLREEGYGFLRTNGYLPGPDDVYVSISQVRRFALRRGDLLEGTARPAGTNEKYPALVRIDQVSGQGADEARDRVRFESLTPLFPDHKLRLEQANDPSNVTSRIVDLIAPIGKGQRGLLVSPPKAGKTTILKQVAHSIEANNPDVHLIVLLVDERPEEVTDMRRSVKGEVVASTFDRPSEEHTQVAELVIERAKRMVEKGQDVVVVLDGITRLARAYNLAQPATGRVMSGGIDTGALYPPKKFFGAARNIEEGGSLTILATALVETGSRMDEVIFEEFKGTGNMELRLDRRLAERRVYPAIDVNGSSTRHEELLFDRTQLEQVWKLRRVLGALAAEGTNAASLELLMDKIRQTRSNDEFLAEIAKNPAPAV